MGMSAVGGGKGIGPAGKHQPSGNVVRQSPTIRPELLQVHPQGRWRSPGAARRSREKTPGSTWVHGVGTGPWALNSSRDGFAQKLHHFSSGRAFTTASGSSSSCRGRQPSPRNFRAVRLDGPDIVGALEGGGVGAVALAHRALHLLDRDVLFLFQPGPQT